MKISETDILLLPGYGDTPAGHWMHRWCEKMPTARIVAQRNWFRPVLKEWIETLKAAVDEAERPVVLVGHSLGSITAVHAAHGHGLDTDKIRAAFLVAPTDLGREEPKPAFDAAPLPGRAEGAASLLRPHRRQPHRSLLRLRDGRADGSRLGRPFPGRGRCRPYQPGKRPRPLAGRADVLRLSDEGPVRGLLARLVPRAAEAELPHAPAGASRAR